MSISLLNLDAETKTVLKKYQHLPKKAKELVRKQVDELLEKLEDEEDLKEARARMKEKPIPFDEVVKELGLK